MSMQLTSDCTPGHQREQRPIIRNEACLDASDIARGVGYIIGFPWEQPKVETK